VGWLPKFRIQFGQPLRRADIDPLAGMQFPGGTPCIHRGTQQGRQLCRLAAPDFRE
jgi:hypothetical protein